MRILSVLKVCYLIYLIYLVLLVLVGHLKMNYLLTLSSYTTPLWLGIYDTTVG